MAWFLSNSAGRRCHLLVFAMSAVRKKTILVGSLAGFPVQVVPKHSQYSLRIARPASTTSMPLCWAVPYSRLEACESWGLRFWREAAKCDGASTSRVTVQVGSESAIGVGSPSHGGSASASAGGGGGGQCSGQRGGSASGDHRIWRRRRHWRRSLGRRLLRSQRRGCVAARSLGCEAPSHFWVSGCRGSCRVGGTVTVPPSHWQAAIGLGTSTVTGGSLHDGAPSQGFKLVTAHHSLRLSTGG